MKNLKLILMTIFTTIGVTEITHPIIFTGPARRQAHRDQEALLEEQALYLDENQNQSDQNEFDASSQDYNEHDTIDDTDNDDQDVYVQFLENRRNENNEDYYNEEYYEVPSYPYPSYVQIQSMDYNENDSDYLESDYLDSDYLDTDYLDADDQNYADDAVVQIQALGDGSFLSQLQQSSPEKKLGDGSLLSSLDPEKKEELKEKLMTRLKDRKNGNSPTSGSSVVTQSLSYDDQDYDSDDYVEIQAVEEEQEDEKPALFAIDHEKSDASDESHHLAVEEKSPESSLHQAAQTSADFAEAAKHDEHTIIAEPQHPAVVESIAHPSVAVEPTPVVATKPIEQPAPVERIRIVKVYPVYDAVMSAFEHVKSATQDMVNYVYSLVAKK